MSPRIAIIGAGVGGVAILEALTAVRMQDPVGEQPGGGLPQRDPAPKRAVQRGDRVVGQLAYHLHVHVEPGQCGDHRRERGGPQRPAEQPHRVGGVWQGRGVRVPTPRPLHCGHSVSR